MPLPKSFGLAKGWPVAGGQVEETFRDLGLNERRFRTTLAAGAAISPILNPAPGSSLSIVSGDGRFTIAGTTLYRGATAATAGDYALTIAEDRPGAKRRTTGFVMTAYEGEGAGGGGPVYVTLPTTSSIVVIGDSITAGQGASSNAFRFSTLLATAMGATELNRGYSGSEVQDSKDLPNNFRSRFATDAFGGNKRAKMVIAGGRNDAFELQDGIFNLAGFVRSYSEMLNYARANGYAATDIILVSPFWQPDATFVADPDGVTRSLYELYVAAVYDLAVEFGTYYFDAYAYMRDNGAGALIDDGVHPNNTGHAAIRTGFVNALQRPNTLSLATPTASSSADNTLNYNVAMVTDAVTYTVEFSAADYTYAGTVTGASNAGAFTLSAGIYRLRSRANMAGGSHTPWAYSSTQAVVEPVVGPWTPAALGTAVPAWFDADYAPSLTTSSGFLSAWASRTGSATLTQATGGIQPAIATNASLGGKNAITASGTQRLVASASMSAMGLPGVKSLVFSLSPGSPQGPGTISTNMASAGATVAGLPTSGGALASVVWASGATSATYYSAGSSLGTGALGATSTSAAAIFIVYEASPDTNGRLCDDSTALNFLNRAAGDRAVSKGVAEIVMVNRALATLERQQMEGYLAWKYGLQAQLPVGHPYLSAAP